MAITYEKISKKIKGNKYASLNRALFSIKRTALSKSEKAELSKLATDTAAAALVEKPKKQPAAPLIQPPLSSESVVSKVDGGRTLSAKAEPEQIMAFDSRLTELAFHFLSVAVDFKLSKEELGRRLATKLKTI